jgi:hypothetical protein
MSPQNQDGAAESLSRRSVLAALGGGVTGGLAGCTSNGGSTETPTSGGSVAPETTTSEDSGTEPSRLDCGRNVLANIPGEVVHNGVDSIRVLAHGVCRFTGGGNILVRVQNTGNQTLVPEFSAALAENPLFIQARTLSSEGNPLEMEAVSAGPKEIRPGTEATVRTRAPIDRSQVARYELCILPRSPTGEEWEAKCGG